MPGKKSSRSKTGSVKVRTDLYVPSSPITSKSIFKMNHLENKVMVLAFVLGLILQILVTEIPFLTELMGTTALSFLEWMGILFVSIIPLIFHELFVLIKKVQKK